MKITLDGHCVEIVEQSNQIVSSQYAIVSEHYSPTFRPFLQEYCVWCPTCSLAFYPATSSTSQRLASSPQEIPPTRDHPQAGLVCFADHISLIYHLHRFRSCATFITYFL